MHHYDSYEIVVGRYAKGQHPTYTAHTAARPPARLRHCSNLPCCTAPLRTHPAHMPCRTAPLSTCPTAPHRCAHALPHCTAAHTAPLGAHAHTIHIHVLHALSAKRRNPSATHTTTRAKPQVTPPVSRACVTVSVSFESNTNICLFFRLCVSSCQ